jgi:hypothetical protein
VDFELYDNRGRIRVLGYGPAPVTASAVR